MTTTTTTTRPVKTLLVPLDGSALADAILPHVERFLADGPCDVLLLRVLPPADAAEEVPGQAQLERDAMQAHLDTTRARLEALGARVTTIVREGDPAAEILFAIDQHSPSLVAMSSHGRSGVLRWIRGSVAERVLRSCATPMLLVTPRADEGGVEQRFRRILVPLDGGERSATILPAVTDLARRHDAEVLLLRVEQEGLSRPMLAVALNPAKVVESLRPWMERLASDGVRCRALAAQGDSASEILDAAEREGADLIAMTTHGRTGLSRLVDGSVSERVLRHCRRPLLVVHAEAS
jgi:nucleotide-binding universal stress UspA family protein